MSSLRRWASDVLFRLKHGGSDVWEVTSDEERLTLHRNRRAIKQLLWKDVDVIHAEKKDLLTTEGIILVFHASSGESLYVEELILGFKSLVSAMETRFPNLNRNWYSELNGGRPFDHQRVEIWKKS